MRARRSLLFAPGDREEVHAKALAAGPDIVCIDLEDAVAPTRKAIARDIAVPFLRADPRVERALRINSPRSAEGLRDLLAVIAARPDAGVIFLPKVATADEVRWVDDLLSESGLSLGLGVLIESVEGLENVVPILSASPRIVFAMFGGADLSAELGVEISETPLLYARSRVVHAAKLAGIDVLDVPSLAFRDEAVVRADARHAKALGFTGKGVIHPSNVAVVNATFSPTPDEVAAAERVMEAYRASETGLAVVDGKLVERPVIRAMERILALHGIGQTDEKK
ncbi:HpcH/HpaI aldolase/citrate lyase family protein [Oceanibacterium hippocampi]|uniref:HpcH/HpaI aldolase/citrate lyase family protein n=1 Tax=Oceanibacterium hippocampi TaxID=745714 RepID=UPI001C3948A6|nr:CoA ester lyase [Oceanibacterium hippocampi]